MAPSEAWVHARLPEARAIPRGFDCATARGVTLPSNVAATTVPEVGASVPFVVQYTPLLSVTMSSGPACPDATTIGGHGPPSQTQCPSKISGASVGIESLATSGVTSGIAS